MLAHPCPADMICAPYGNESYCFHPGVWRCGNGKLEPGEQCDLQDFGGLTCSDFKGRPETPRCTDLCTVVCCGNDKIEGSGESGEECDDYNDQSQDGCSSSCTNEMPGWLPHEGGWGQGRIHHTMAYFPPRSAVILLGGVLPNDVTQHPLGGTWEYDGARWWRLSPTASPPARWLHAVVYDSQRERLVMFGGVDAQGDWLGDTWEYDGDTWTQVTGPGPAPAARFGHAMAYDRQRGVTVLFGGTETLGPIQFYADTWEFDGATWTDRTATAGEPPSVTGHTLTYDASRMQTVLIGGTTVGEGLLIDTLPTLWRYDGAQWIDSDASPDASFVLAAQWDDTRHRVVVMGAPLGGNVSEQLYFWNGAEFETRPTYAYPGERAGFALAYDSARRHLVLFGGSTQDIAHNTVVYTDTWEFDGHDWIDAAPIVGPVAPNSALAVAYDTQAQRLFVLTGTEPAETWAFDGNDLGWRQLPVAAPPGQVQGAPMVYDEARGGFLLFGVADPVTGLENQTWIFDGMSWERLPVVDPPQVSRSCARMVYDGVRQRTLLVAGDVDTDGSPRGEASTYVLEGTQWRRLDTAGLPVSVQERPCLQAVMTYDASEVRPLMVGHDLTVDLIEPPVFTWAHNGERWVKLATVTTPSYSLVNMAAMTYDPLIRRSILLVRNRDLTVQTWELRGLVWVETTSPNGPVAIQAAPRLTYDWARQATLLVLPSGLGTPSEQTWSFDTWEYRYLSYAPAEVCDDLFEVDEDGDLRANCHDPDCYFHPACL